MNQSSNERKVKKSTYDKDRQANMSDANKVLEAKKKAEARDEKARENFLKNPSCQLIHPGTPEDLAYDKNEFQSHIDHSMLQYSADILKQNIKKEQK